MSCDTAGISHGRILRVPIPADGGSPAIASFAVEPSDVQRIADVIAEAAQAGSPVAGGDEEGRRAMAAVAIRRWNSFDRRARKKRAGTEDRVEDLAKGLPTPTSQTLHSSGLTSSGPLMEDYRWLARRIAEELVSE